MKKSKKDWYEDVIHIARQKGGEVLTHSYINAHSKMEFRCIHGHTWLASPANILRGRWCHVCGGTDRKILDDCKNLAKQKNGQCLSEKYINSNSPLLWRCQRCGYEWEATFANVKKGKWCPHCAGNLSLTLQLMQDLAKSRDGIYLSKTYVNNHSKIEWQCGLCGNIWAATPAQIQRGSWCPECANRQKGSYHRLSIDSMKELAVRRGGECLSNEYINNSTPLLWRCGYCGKTWKARPDNIKNGKWCPDCNDGLAERICRTVIEQLYGKPFPTVWPEWLVNSDGNRMELDGYCDELKLAFEHQGTQHYRYIRRFHGSQAGFEHQQKLDLEKEALCRVHGIYLIKIPEVLNQLSVFEVKSYIIKELLKIGFEYIPDNMQSIEISFKDIYVPDSIAQLKIIRELVTAKGGELLSEKYISNKTPLEVRCGKCRNVWKIRPDNLKHGKWCPRCNKYRKRYTLLDMQKWAEEKGGKCLSEEYLGNNVRLIWECEVGHTWLATPAKVLASGSWCKICSYISVGKTNRLTIHEMLSLAEQKGGKCLSKEYLNAHSKLQWQCGKCDYIWNATPSSIKGSNGRKGTWCPRCAGKA